MEALVVVGLVCNTAQLVEQGLELVKICRDVSKTGSFQQNDQLAVFSTLATSVSEACVKSPISTTSPSSDRQMHDCALKCVSAARKLCATARHVWYEADGTTERGRVDKLYRYRKSRSEIRRLQDVFAKQHSLLQTSLLISIRDRIAADRNHQAPQQLASNDHIRKLLDGDCTAAREASEAIQRFENEMQTMLTSVKFEIDTSKTAVVSEMQQLALDDRSRAALDAVMSRLEFPGMHDRENSIRNRVSDYGATAKWIFGDFDDVESDGLSNERLQHMRELSARFNQWIVDGTGIWFIEGKPGSGKSSLMSYIRAHLQCESRKAAPFDMALKGCHILSFFFFRPSGSKLTKCFEGLWRSLCYQVLYAEPELVSSIILDARAPRSLQTALSGTRSMPISFRTEDLRVWFE